MAKFQAMIDLFESPEDVSGANGRCIQLAKRRLDEFRQQYEAQSQEQLNLVEERIKRADEMRKTDPEQAKAIYHAVVDALSKQGLGEGCGRKGRHRAGRLDRRESTKLRKSDNTANYGLKL